MTTSIDTDHLRLAWPNEGHVGTHHRLPTEATMKRIELSHQFGRDPLWIMYIYDNDDELIADVPIDAVAGIALSDLPAFQFNRTTSRWIAT